MVKHITRRKKNTSRRIPESTHPTVQRGIHRSVKCVFLAMAFCSAIQVAFIRSLTKPKPRLTDSYERCQTNNSVLDHIIEDNHYIGIGP